MPKSNCTVRIGRMEFNCTVDWSECPGEPMVRYYADGSGYPGCDASVDCIDYVEVNECEWFRGYDGPDEDWGYTDLSDRPGAKEIAERWIFAELSDGSYDDELFADADYPEDYDYVD